MNRKKVKTILQESASFENGKLYLTKKLDRKEYETVKNFLEKYDITWGRANGAFVAKYPEDMRKIAMFAATGMLPKSKRENHFFETPKKLVERLLSECGLEDEDFMFKNLKVLEPSAGRGAIFKELVKRFDPKNITAIELDKSNYLYLKRKFPQVNVVHGDFLKTSFTEKFDYILMNPPFNKNEYAKHILKAQKLLNRTGTLAAIAPTNFLISPYDKFTKTRRKAPSFSSGDIRRQKS